MIDKKINSPVTSGAGRLFDAVSAILGLSSFPDLIQRLLCCSNQSSASGIDDHYPFERGEKVVFAKTLMAMVKDLNTYRNICNISKVS